MKSVEKETKILMLNWWWVITFYGIIKTVVQNACFAVQARRLRCCNSVIFQNEPIYCKKLADDRPGHIFRAPDVWCCVVRYTFFCSPWTDPWSQCVAKRLLKFAIIYSLDDFKDSKRPTVKGQKLTEKYTVWYIPFRPWQAAFRVAYGWLHRHHERYVNGY